MFYKFGKGLFVLITRFLFDVRIHGREHIPTDRGYILISNHRSNFDPMLIVQGMREQVHFMAKAELFRTWLTRLVFSSLGAFPVERGRGDTSALEKAREILQSGRVLGMFPEGTRSKDGKPQRPKSGAAMIAMQTGATVVPCAVCFGDRLRFRARIDVRYGTPVTCEQLGFHDASSAHDLRGASRALMDKILALMEESSP